MLGMNPKGLHKSIKQVRTRNRGAILRSLKEIAVPRYIRWLSGGAIAVYTEPWGAYWQPVESLNSGQKKCLDELHEVWHEYIRGDFPVQLRRQYCLSYFRLLESVIADEVAKRRDHSRFLQRIVGFENLAIYPNSISGFSTTAATSTLRNPSYLLAKLRQPAAIDDCRFLPLITTPDYKPVQLFYHYRRYCLAPHSGHSLLVFLPVCQKLRLQAFQTLGKFSYLISSDTDPRTSQRALRLVERILVPYLETVGFNEKSSEEVTTDIELVDLGAGTGSLLGKVCQMLQSSLASQGKQIHFRTWMVDINPGNPVRFARTNIVRKAMDCFVSASGEVMEWIEQQSLPKAKGCRFAFIFRLFNNLSSFDIKSFALDSKILHEYSHVDAWQETLPTRCLNSKNSQDRQKLKINPSPLWIRQGRVYQHLSLSQYFKSLRLLTEKLQFEATVSQQRGPWLPVRQFDRNILLGKNGQSLLSRLLDSCQLVVIEDVDLRPDDIEDHCRQAGLSNALVLDVSRKLSLRGCFCYIIGHRQDRALADLKGAMWEKRIW